MHGSSQLARTLGRGKRPFGDDGSDSVSRGRFRLKLFSSHAGIFPEFEATAYFATFKINGSGDEYCASDGSATPARNDHTTFLVRNDDGTACQPACSSPSGAFLDASAAF